MIFEYDYEESEFFDPTTRQRGKLYHPVLTVQLIKRGFRLYPIDCLLDSGADTIIFPARLALFFNIPYKIGRPVEFKIAGGGSAIFYELPYEQHGIAIFVNDIPVREKIAFSEGQQLPLFGQDFFKYFKIAFDRKNKKFFLEI